MHENDEERAYAEILSKLCDNDSLITLLNPCWRNASNAPYDSATSLAQYSTWLLNLEGWWYLIFRTCNAIGAKLIITFFRNHWLKVEVPPVPPATNPTYRNMTEAEKKAFFRSRGTPRKPGIPKEVIRKEFTYFMRSQTNWIQQSYGSVAAGDIGPWPKTGDSGD